MNLEDQILLFKFIKHSALVSERISEYLDKPETFSKKFLDFVKTYKEFEEKSLSEILSDVLHSKGGDFES